MYMHEHSRYINVKQTKLIDNALHAPDCIFRAITCTNRFEHFT